MANNQETKIEGVNANSSRSSVQRTVILKDWWLIECPNEVNGKRFGVAGNEIAASVNTPTRAIRVFTSSPIIKTYDLFTLESSDGISIILRGFLHKEHVVQNGFLREICKDFMFGFPPAWEQLCNSCFKGEVDPTPSTIPRACFPVLSPCYNIKTECRLGESKDKTAGGDQQGSKVKEDGENSFGDRAKRKIDFDVEVTPVKEVKKQKPDKVSKVTLVKEVKEQRTDKVSKVRPAEEVKKKKTDKVSKVPPAKEVKKEKTDEVSKVPPAKEVKKENTDKVSKVTPVKEVKKEKTEDVSSGSLGQRRSRSGRVLVSPLEFWRNQIPVYDVDRNLTEIKEGRYRILASQGDENHI